MKYDIVALLTTILKEAGVADVMDKELSNHSTIALNMKDDIPTIYIKNEDDEVWIWAKLSDYVPSTLTYNSANLIPVMLNHNEEYFYAGQPCLYPIEGNLELRIQVKEKYLDSAEEFLSMLDLYLKILQEYRSVLI